MKHQDQKQKRRFFRKLNTAAILLCAGVFLFCAGVLVYQFVILPEQSDVATNAAKTLYRGTPGDSVSASSEEGDGTNPLEALQKENPDVEGWITVPGTVIDYPVLRSPGNDQNYYLTHDWQKQSTKYGSIFTVGSGQAAAGESRVLFGHSMRDGRMFASLLKYGGLDFYRSHPTFTYQDKDGKTQWKIFAVIKVNTEPSQGQPFNYLRTDFSTDDDFFGFLYQVRLRSVLTIPVDLRASDEILALSTCSYEFDEFRTAVFARRVRPGESTSVETGEASVNAKTLYPDCWYKKYGGQKPSFPSFAEAKEQGQIPWLAP